MDSPVSICAGGCICAAGNDTDSCFETMLSERVAPVYKLDSFFDQELTSPVFSVDDSLLGDEESSHLLTDTMKLLLKATDEAVTQAGISPEISNTLTIGCCIGSSTGASLNFKSFYQQWKEDKNPDLGIIRSYLHSNPAACLAERYNFNGPTQTVTNACSSGTDAIGIGSSWIRQGLCDLVIAGGADALSDISYTGFSRLMITSPESCRPFDRNRQGLNLGEGAAVLILASEKGRKTLGLPPHAYVAGYGTCCDAHHMTAPHPEGAGLKKAIAESLKRSGISAGEIDFINVHGTGTMNNDQVEGLVIKDIFPQTPFTGTKGFTGHTLGAAGAIEALMTIESLRTGKLMPTAGFEEEDPAIGLSPVHKSMEISARYAISDSLAFGGNNSALVFKRED